MACASLFVYCILLSQHECVWKTMFTRINLHENNHQRSILDPGWCFISTDQRDMARMQDRNSRFPINCYAAPMSIAFNQCRPDYIFEWNITQSNRKEKVIIHTNKTSTSLSSTSLSSILIPLQISTNVSRTTCQAIVCQSSMCNNDNVASECNINTSLHFISPLCPSNATHFTTKNDISPSIDGDSHKCDSSYKRFDYSTNVARKSPISDSSISHRQWKRLVPVIQCRIKTVFASLTIFLMAIVSLVVVVTDLLKNGFSIGPSRRKRRRTQQKSRVKYLKDYKPTFIRRPAYVNAPNLETIPEEDEVPS